MPGEAGTRAGATLPHHMSKAKIETTKDKGTRPEDEQRRGFLNGAGMFPICAN